MTTQASPRRGHGETAAATVLGFCAILLWAALAALTTVAGPIPPFQMSAMTFAVGTLAGVMWTWLRGQSLREMRQAPLSAWLLGVYGLLGFHVCYFLALQKAPAIEASLIIYLWPLLIVLCSSLLPVALGGRRLNALHIAGALCGLAGTVLILTSRGGGVNFGGMSDGYLFAGLAAVIWASYSVGLRLFSAVPGAIVVGSCGLTAIGAAVIHSAVETTYVPGSTSAWLAVLALGIGPVGIAFNLWDEGMKRGNLRLLGVASYATPLLSTLLLSGLGLARATAAIWIAAGLVTTGAVLASRGERSSKTSIDQ
ncbi:MAG: EamA family transporter [Hyphomicrobiaceae bacterium]